MKRIVIELPREFVIKYGYKEIFDYVERFELLRIYRYDTHDMLTMQKFKFINPKTRPKHLLGLNGISFIEVLKENPSENEYTCLVKTHSITGFTELFEHFDLILDYPLIITPDTLKIPFISHQDELKAVVDQIRTLVGEDLKILGISAVQSEFDNLYNILTQKQLDIMTYSAKAGFFDIPRKISTNELANKFNISKSALNEHMRKVERKIFNFLFKTNI